MNKALTNIPYFIVSYWVLSCFLFYFQNSWFFDNYFLLNRIDDCIWAIMMLHLMFNHSLYNKTKKVLITTTVAIALCQELQYHLKEQGYLTANATGYFGPATMLALKNWQKKNAYNPKMEKLEKLFKAKLKN